jgi:glycosyltransferase involved in cell wall biosynthesis
MNVLNAPCRQGNEGEAARAPSRILVSVIIPTLNEQGSIGRCLDALKRMDFPKESFEVILVDNGSHDRTLEIAKSYAIALNLRILQRPKVYVSSLRNLGAAASRGDYLAFLDADVIVSRDWMCAAVAALRRKEAGIVGGPYHIPGNSSWVAEVWFEYRKPYESGDVSYLASGNLFISRTLFTRLGGFDETIETNEDYEFCQRARAAGLPIQAFPELGVEHLGTPQKLSAFYRRERWHGTHVFRVFLRNPLKLPNAKAVFFAFYTLICLIGVLCGIGIFAASGRFQTLLLSWLALLLMPAALSLRVAFSRGRWINFFPLTLLHLTYGVARALCLVNYRTWAGGKKSRASQRDKQLAFGEKA